MDLLKYFRADKSSNSQTGPQTNSGELNPGAEVTDKQVTEALAKVIDPETGVDIVALGLIYKISVSNRDVRVEMTMTTPSCPVVGLMMDQAKENIEQLPGVNSVEIDLVWEPRWKVDMMSESAKKQLGW